MSTRHVEDPAFAEEFPQDDPGFAGPVPDVDRDAVVDPHWLRLRGESLLPVLYMPAIMPGPHRGWMRAVAAFLIAIFVTATAAGVCLVYGAPGWPF